MSVRQSGLDPATPDLGIVYLLTNPLMPNIIKLGLTRNEDVSERLRTLDTSALPMRFEVAYAAKVPDCAKLERVLHQVFADKRLRQNREFFTANPEIARLIIDLVRIEERPVSDAEQGITPDQRTDMEEAKQRRAQPITLERLGLKPGTLLTFVKDPTITCEIADAPRVRFRGQVMSLSGSALLVLHELGFNWSTCAGADLWTYEGVKLNAISKLEPAAPELDASG